jgi:hypothetical protein
MKTRKRTNELMDLTDLPDDVLARVLASRLSFTAARVCGRFQRLHLAWVLANTAVDTVRGRKRIALAGIVSEYRLGTAEVALDGVVVSMTYRKHCDQWWMQRREHNYALVYQAFIPGDIVLAADWTPGLLSSYKVLPADQLLVAAAARAARGELPWGLAG